VRSLVLVLVLAGAAQADPARTPVVLELFTSHGCSSCPAADELLSELGAQEGVIPLEFHVDYWDGQGWKDSFSSPRWTARQAAYGAALGLGAYTPELVVSGMAHVVGSDRPKVLAAVESAARAPAEPVTATATRWRHTVRVSYDVGRGRSDRRVVVAVTESGLVTKIGRGENKGKTVRDDFVVRALTEVEPGAGTAELPIDPSWGPLRAVVLLQDAKTLAVRGAAAVEVHGQ
jgi:hypothetical protein